uniref:Uncharacterized protein n=1 Tax=Lactuca sativa TaxID=4236 RepID=A0A9R1X025_LACSA|nr:hypothetical protein LSAT_V11C800391470 [Lactuca sativa]
MVVGLPWRKAVGAPIGIREIIDPSNDGRENKREETFLRFCQNRLKSDNWAEIKSLGQQKLNQTINFDISIKIDQMNSPREIKASITNLASPSEVISPILTYTSTPPLSISPFPTEELQDGDLSLREKNEIAGTKCHRAKLQGSKKDKEIGKSHVAFPLSLHGNINEGEDVNTIDENVDQKEHKSQHEGNNSTISSPLAPLMEVVSGECVYVCAMWIKALTWMQNPQASFLKLSNLVWSTAWLNIFL